MRLDGWQEGATVPPLTAGESGQEMAGAKANIPKSEIKEKVGGMGTGSEARQEAGLKGRVGRQEDGTPQVGGGPGGAWAD